MEACVVLISLFIGWLMGLFTGVLGTKAKTLDDVMRWLSREIGPQLQDGQCFYMEFGKDSDDDDGDDDEEEVVPHPNYDYSGRN